MRLELWPSCFFSLTAEVQEKRPLVLLLQLFFFCAKVCVRVSEGDRGAFWIVVITLRDPGQDAGVVRVHRPPLDEPQHGRAHEPAERQQPERRHAQQVQSRCHGGTQPRTTVRPERAVLQRPEHKNRHEV